MIERVVTGLPIVLPSPYGVGISQEGQVNGSIAADNLIGMGGTSNGIRTPYRFTAIEGFEGGADVVTMSGVTRMEIAQTIPENSPINAMPSMVPPTESGSTRVGPTPSEPTVAVPAYSEPPVNPPTHKEPPVVPPLSPEEYDKLPVIPPTHPAPLEPMPVKPVEKTVISGGIPTDFLPPPHLQNTFPPLPLTMLPIGSKRPLRGTSWRF